MRPRSSPAHAREEPPTLHSEDVIASERWRARVGPGPGADEALERAPALSLRGRIARAVKTPVVAGIAVFVAAVLVTIGIAAASSLGAQLPSDAAAGETDALASAAELGADVNADVEAGNSGGANDVAAGVPPGAAAATPIFVHVVGAVARSGVVELSPGARVQDAIDAAGGASKDAVLSGVNLARLVVDGEQLLVPDAAAIEAGAASASAAGSSSAAGAGANAGSETGPGGGTAAGAAGGDPAAALVNLNTADVALLETLPRVGPALAGRIIDWREQNGGFASVDQLLEVSGIGAKTLAGFLDRVTV